MDDACGAAAIQCDRALTSVFSVLGKRWTGVVIGVLLERPARFAEIARAIPGITESMLSARLSELKEAGLVTREVSRVRPSRRGTGSRRAARHCGRRSLRSAHGRMRT